MLLAKNYYNLAKEHEEVFRNILRDLKSNREERPLAEFIPSNLSTEESIENIFNAYTAGFRWGKPFTITSFSRPEKPRAYIGIGLSIPGIFRVEELEYIVKDDSSVRYLGCTTIGLGF